jgi:hypothetical protein
MRRLIFFRAAATPSGGGELTYTTEWAAPLSPGGTVTGYVVRWGQTSLALEFSHQTSGVATTYTIPGLTAGTWYYTVATIVGGIESDPSFEFEFTV